MAPVVETKYGKLQGTILHLPDNDKPALAYLNIPFAAPPVAKLRFEVPKPVEPWEGIRDASQHGMNDH